MSISSIVANDELHAAIEKSARQLASFWPGMVTAEEVANEIWMDLLDKPGDLKKAQELNGNALREFVDKRGGRFVAKEWEDYDYFTGNFFYSTNDVRELLSRGVLVKGRERTWTERQDVDRGMAALSVRDQSALDYWEDQGKAKGRPKPLKYAQIIYRAYVTGDYASNGPDRGRHLTQSVTALTREMNRAHGKYSNPERFRQKPTTKVTIRNKYDDSVNYTRQLTDAEWDKTAGEYAKDLAAYNQTRPYGGPGSRTIRIGTPERIDPDKASDPDENEIRVVEPEYLEDSF